MTDPDLVDVRLLALPLDLYAASSQHQQALQREFDVIASGEGGRALVPATLLEVVRELEERYGRFARAGYAELDEALARGDTQIDVTYRLPASAGDAAAHLAQLLELADEYCRAGRHLLTPAAPPPLASFRRWFLAEVVGQIDGRPPIPWPEHGVDDEDLPGRAPGAPRDLDLDLDAVLPEGWELRRDGGGTIVAVAGDLDLGSAAPLRDVLALAHRAGGDVHIDARSVTFLDSLAMSVLVTARNRVVDSGARFRLEAPPAVVRTLELAGLVDLLGVELVEDGR